MQKNFSLNDVDEKIKEKISTQNYSAKRIIEGVKIINLKNNVGEAGDFSEILRIDENNELETLPGFKIRQINRTKLLPKGIKAWHLHFEQEELWYINPRDHLFVGLWDIRKNSSTNGVTMRVNLGGGTSQLLLIPKGVAHGSANFSEKPIELYYFANQRFNRENPDEKRIKWDILGSEFWSPIKD